MFSLSPLFGQARQILGVDIGVDNIKAVLLKNVKGKPFIEGVALSPTPKGLLSKDGVVTSPFTLTEALRIIISAYDLRASRAVVALNSNLVRIIEITIPAVPKEDVDEIVKWEAAKILDFPIEESSYDYRFLSMVDREGKDTYKGLLVAVPLTLVDPIVKGFARAGLKLAAIELDAYAEARTLRFLPDFSVDVVYVMLNIGATSSMLNLYAQGIVLFSRAISFGGNAITNIIKEEMQLSHLEAERVKKEENLLAGADVSGDYKEIRERVLEVLEDTLFSEVHRAIAFAQQEWRHAFPGSTMVLILSGGGASLKGLRDVMEENLGFKTVLNTALLQVPSRKNLDKKLLGESTLLLSCALGLALRIFYEEPSYV